MTTVEQSQFVFVIDDDEAVRDSMGMLLESADLAYRCFDSADSFFEQHDTTQRGCLVLDIRMPGMTGLELQQRLTETGSALPIIFITGHGDVPMAVEAMQLGAFDFVQKPFRDQELVDRVTQALSLNQEEQENTAHRRHVLDCYNELTPREKEVMHCVVKGQANKVIAMDLEVSQRTVEIHRARVMEKMRARSLADLVRMAMELDD
jgi:two-component system response regulator FixJ